MNIEEVKNRLIEYENKGFKADVSIAGLCYVCDIDAAEDGCWFYFRDCRWKIDYTNISSITEETLGRYIIINSDSMKDKNFNISGQQKPDDSQSGPLVSILKQMAQQNAIASLEICGEPMMFVMSKVSPNRDDDGCLMLYNEKLKLKLLLDWRSVVQVVFHTMHGIKIAI